MTDNLRARSATELADAAIQLYRHNFRAILTVAGFGMAPYIAIQPLFVHLTGPDAEVGVAPGLMSLLLTMLALLWRTLAGAAIIAAAAHAYRGEPVDVGAAFSEVFERPGALLYGAFMKGAAIFLGAILFLVGALYFYATYFALPTTIVVEKTNGSQGVERARQLAAGYRWHAFKPLLVMGILYFVSYFAIEFLGRMIFGDSLVLNGIFTSVFTVFVLPLVPITEMLVYYDLRIRKEGYDVEVMAARLDPQVS